MEKLLSALLMGIIVGGLYSLVALPMVVIYKSTKIFNFAQGYMLMLLAWIVWAFTSQAGLPFWVSVVLGLVVAVVVGILTERLCFRQLIGQPILSSIIVTLALGTFLAGIVYFLWGNINAEVYPGFVSAEAIKIGPVTVSLQHLIFFFAALALIGIFSHFFKYSNPGLAMRAVAEDHQVTQAMGINVISVFRNVWVIAYILAAVAGILLASINGVTLWLNEVALAAFVVILMGGLDSVLGVLVAGPVVGIIQKLAGEYLDPLVGGGLMEVMPFVILLIVILIKPYGLFGLERIERI